MLLPPVPDAPSWLWDVMTAVEVAAINWRISCFSTFGLVFFIGFFFGGGPVN